MEGGSAGPCGGEETMEIYANGTLCVNVIMKGSPPGSKDTIKGGGGGGGNPIKIGTDYQVRKKSCMYVIYLTYMYL